MSELTSPEQFVHMRQVKRYMAKVRRDGICCVCIHRQQTLGQWHCRNDESKQRGACQLTQASYPKFQVVENVLDEFKDAA